MNKKLTPLEQIEELLQKTRETYRNKNTNEQDTIFALGEENAYVNVLNIAEHSLEALEIIKTVCPNIFWVMRTSTYREYKKKCVDDTLLQEEYKTLKEVLNDE